MTSTPIPYDAEAESSLIGAAIMWPERIEDVAADLAPEDFYAHRNQALWSAIIDLIGEGTKPDAVALADRASRHGTGVEVAELLDLQREALPPQREHVEIVLRHAASRRTMHVLAEGRVALDGGADPYAVASDTARDLDAVGASGTGGEVEAMTLPALIASADTVAPWVIEGLMRQDWRAVIVAGEGIGKSTLLRQLAVCAAQGIHPLNYRPIPPVRTLVVDAENPRAAIAETGARLDAHVRQAAGNAYDAGRCLVWSRPGGLDLRTPRDRADLIRELRAARPQLVVAGPVYKLGRRQPKESYEDAAEGVLAVLDDLRTRFGFALVLEHHAPKAQGGYRDFLPFGSQRWLAWPELGINLRAEKDGTGLRVGRFRGDRLQCAWPDRLTRGDVWPWAGVWEHGMDGGF